VKRFHVLIALVLTGCATSAAFRSGERAERRQDYDRAVLEYSTDNPRYAFGLAGDWTTFPSYSALEAVSVRFYLRYTK